MKAVVFASCEWLAMCHTTDRGSLTTLVCSPIDDDCEFTGLNPLIIFVPVSWALHFALKTTPENQEKYGTIVFVSAYLVLFKFCSNLTANSMLCIIAASFIAIIPLAKLLAWATEELAMYVGEVVGGLLNATCEFSTSLTSFSNATSQIEPKPTSMLLLSQSET
jgi:hypothetical protein